MPAHALIETSAHSLTRPDAAPGTVSTPEPGHFERNCSVSPVHAPVTAASHCPDCRQVTLAEPPSVQAAEQVCPIRLPAQLPGQLPLVRGAVGNPLQLVGGSARAQSQDDNMQQHVSTICLFCSTHHAAHSSAHDQQSATRQHLLTCTLPCDGCAPSACDQAHTGRCPAPGAVCGTGLTHRAASTTGGPGAIGERQGWRSIATGSCSTNKATDGNQHRPYLSGVECVMLRVVTPQVSRSSCLQCNRAVHPLAVAWRDPVDRNSLTTARGA